MSISLIICGSANAANIGKMVALAGEDPVCLVGSDDGACDLALPGEAGLAGLHFMLRVAEGRCQLFVLQGQPPVMLRTAEEQTFRAVERAELHNRDLIRAGQVLLRVAIAKAGSAPPSVATPPAAMTAPKPNPQPTMPVQPKTGPLPAAVASKSNPQVVLGARPKSEPSLNLPGQQGELAQPTARLAKPRCPACGTPMDAGGDKVLCFSCMELSRQCRPQDVPGFQKVKSIGQGRISRVFLACRKQERDVVALKTSPLSNNEAGRQALDMFERQRQMLTNLEHPRLVRCLDSGDVEEEHLQYLAMECVPGPNTIEWLKAAFPAPTNYPPTKLVVGFACQVLDALAYLHSKKIVHRGIWPGNVLLATQPPGQDVKLGGFGVARYYDHEELANLTQTGDLRGSLQFMPPEQYQNSRDVKPSADLFAVGATLYFWLTKKHIYDYEDNMELVSLVDSDAPSIPLCERRSDLPQGLTAVIDKALARKPLDRYPDAAAMLRALYSFAT